MGRRAAMRMIGALAAGLRALGRRAAIALIGALATGLHLIGYQAQAAAPPFVLQLAAALANTLIGQALGLGFVRWRGAARILRGGCGLAAGALAYAGAISWIELAWQLPSHANNALFPAAQLGAALFTAAALSD